MYIYIYIHTRTCTHTFICMYVYIYIYIYVYGYCVWLRPCGAARGNRANRWMLRMRNVHMRTRAPTAPVHLACTFALSSISTGIVLSPLYVFSTLMYCPRSSSLHICPWLNIYRDCTVPFVYVNIPIKLVL